MSRYIGENFNGVLFLLREPNSKGEPVIEKDNIIIQTLEKIKPGLIKYQNIMKNLNETNVQEDIMFQKMFNGFYRIRQRNAEFYSCYYELFENSKSEEVSFKNILVHIYKSLGRVEASFSSKLFASLRPDKPVWDSFVLKNLNLKQPNTSDKRRVDKTIELYDSICKWYDDFLLTNEASVIIENFNNMYPHAKITDTKIIDLFLWQTR